MVCSRVEHVSRPSYKAEAVTAVVDDAVAAEQDSLPPAGRRRLEEGNVQVNWLISGGNACSVHAYEGMLVDDVKAQVFEKTVVPVSEQRLFVDGQELSSHSSFSGTAALLWLLRMKSDPRNTNLAHFHGPAAPGPLVGDFATVRQLAPAAHGVVELCDWRRPDGETLRVAVKKVANSAVEKCRGKETNEWKAHVHPQASRDPCPEDVLNELGIFSYLSQQRDLPASLLKSLGIFADPGLDGCTWLVIEYAAAGDLLNVAMGPARLEEAELKSYMRQLLEAIRYLLEHNIGHRDISLENILLQDGTVKLMDFGMAARVRTEWVGLLRYFRALGKDAFCPPECYVPTQSHVAVNVPETASPGDIVMLSSSGGILCEVRLPDSAAPGRRCMAEPWGYAIPPVDIFAAGVCFFALHAQSFPWPLARPHNDCFNFVRGRGDAGLEALLRMWNMPRLSSEGMGLMAEMTRCDPATRPTVSKCLASPWLAPPAAAV